MQGVTHTLSEIVGKKIRYALRIYARTCECGDTAITVSLVLLLLGVAPTDIVAIYTTTFAFSTCPTWGDPRCICWICTRSKIVFRVQFTLSCKKIIVQLIIKCTSLYYKYDILHFIPIITFSSLISNDRLSDKSTEGFFLLLGKIVSVSSFIAIIRLDLSNYINRSNYIKI